MEDTAEFSIFFFPNYALMLFHFCLFCKEYSLLPFSCDAISVNGQMNLAENLNGIIFFF